MPMYGYVQAFSDKSAWFGVENIRTPEVGGEMMKGKPERIDVGTCAIYMDPFNTKETILWNEKGLAKASLVVLPRFPCSSHLRTFSSTLESLDLRVTALEQWRAMGTFHPAPAESTSAEQTAVPEETTVPEQTTVPEDTTVAATAVPEAEEALQMQQGGWGATS